MSFDKPTSEVYFLNTPLSPDRKNTIDFANSTEQLQEFLSYAESNGGYKHFTNVNIIREDRPLNIVGDFGDYYKYNYMIYRNPELSNKWWYAFITNSRYIAKDTTEITFEIDEWQTFQFDITYYKCMIERGIVRRSDDDYKKLTQEEPFEVTPYHQSDNLNINANETYWAPRFILETITYPAKLTEYKDWDYADDSSLGNTFTYGGSDNGTILPTSATTPVWGLKLEGRTGYKSGGWYQTYTEILKLYGDLVDHRTDVLNIRIIPKWLYDGINFRTVYSLENFMPYYIKENNEIDARTNNCEVVFNIDDTTLSNGYSPRNKKMYSSLCRSYLLYNKNGFTKQFLPELITNSYMNITMRGKPIGLSTIFCSARYYKLETESYFTIPYDLTFTAGYNSNVGIQKALSVFNSATQLATGVAQGAIGLRSKNIPPPHRPNGTHEIMISKHSGLRKELDMPPTVGDWDRYGKALNKYNSPRNISPIGALNVANGSLTAIKNGISLAQSLGNVTASKSTANDYTMYSEDKMNLQVVEVNPSIKDCEVIDDYLDMFGYTIEEIDNPSKYLRTRSNWNYIQTTMCNLKCKSSSNYESQLRELFDSGVTIWHSFSAFGKYNSKVDGQWTDINR